MSALQRVIYKIGSVGISENDSYDLKRRKEFFNIIVLLGGLASIPQAIAGFKFDFYAGFFHLAWGAAYIASFFVHFLVNFKVARYVALIPVFIFGTMASLLLGHESYPHIGSLIIFVGVFIIHDPKKEWRHILFYCILEITAILLIESNHFKSPNAPELATFAVRASTFIGATVFISLELVYFFTVIFKNEREINKELRESNAILNQRNQEKDLLLKEIHHRVKNNLQIVSSLLRLQSNEITDEDSKEKFMDSVNRIKSISNLHETIYRSENILSINLNSYLKNLALSLIESYSIKKKIELDIHSDLIDVDNDHIVPISLIMNEMISNSIKHAFTHSEEGKIAISLLKINDKNQYRLLYSDSGSWVESTKSNSFGTELIQSLVEQLNGSIETHPTPEKSEYSILFEVIKSNRI